MINWVLAAGVLMLGTSVFLTWRDRRKARQRALQQLAEVQAMFRQHSAMVVDADPPQKGEHDERS